MKPDDKSGFICFCFQYSKESLLEAIREERENEFIKNLQMRMKDPGCFCERANPSGKCCLADIHRFIELNK